MLSSKYVFGTSIVEWWNIFQSFSGQAFLFLAILVIFPFRSGNLVHFFFCLRPIVLHRYYITSMLKTCTSNVTCSIYLKWIEYFSGRKISISIFVLVLSPACHDTQLMQKIWVSRKYFISVQQGKRILLLKNS